MTKFSIATWNVNSLRVRLPHVQQWLDSTRPDVLALQEIKLINDDFPLNEFQELGYHAIVSGQKTYNGVAILSRHPIESSNMVTDIPHLTDIDPQRRLLAVTINNIRLVNLYIPNGQSVDSDKYRYKLNWLDALNRYLQQELTSATQLLVMGDFNIAPDEIDVHDPKLWAGKVLFSDLEREAFRMLLQLGLKDCYRLKAPDDQSYTWWDYRLNAFRRKMGLRIDHILANESMASSCLRCIIDTNPRSWDRPSDHAPVIAEFEIP